MFWSIINNRPTTSISLNIITRSTGGKDVYVLGLHTTCCTIWKCRKGRATVKKNDQTSCINNICYILVLICRIGQICMTQNLGEADALSEGATSMRTQGHYYKKLINDLFLDL